MSQSENDLPKLAAPAQRALASAGITKLAQLTAWKETDLLDLHGIGPNAIQALHRALDEQGLSFVEQDKSGVLTLRKNRSMPQSVIIPEIPYADVRAAVNWLCRCFGFVERLRIGNHRAQLTFDDGSVIVTGLGNAPTSRYSIMVRVADVDSHYESVKLVGAQILTPPENYPYGERQYTVEDIGGHRWTFSQTVSDIDPRDWGGVLYT